MNGINLLPWRLEKYRQLLFLFLLKMIVVLLVALALYALLAVLHQQQKIALQEQQQVFDLQSNRLTETVQHIAQLKQTMQDFTELQAIAPARVEHTLSVLPELPFQQGELIYFYFDEESIKLKGFSISQMEFEDLHHYLSGLFISTLLTHFQTEQGRLVFQFDLSPEPKTEEK